jgi:hypothetical protein
MYRLTGRAPVPVVPGTSTVPAEPGLLGSCDACRARGRDLVVIPGGGAVCVDFRACCATYRLGVSAESYAAGLGVEP